MTTAQVKAVLANQENPVSALKVTLELGLENSSENVLAVRHECFELVEAGIAVVHDANGNLFFSLV